MQRINLILVNILNSYLQQTDSVYRLQTTFGTKSPITPSPLVPGGNRYWHCITLYWAVMYFFAMYCRFFQRLGRERGCKSEGLPEKMGKMGGIGEMQCVFMDDLNFAVTDMLQRRFFWQLVAFSH